MALLSFCRRVREGEISIHAKQLPMFLYDEDDPDFSLDNLEGGLMRAAIILAVSLLFALLFIDLTFRLVSPWRPHGR